MKKVLGAAVMVLALAGCGGPLEDDGTDATGAQRQQLEQVDGPKAPTDAMKINTDLLHAPAEKLVGRPDFQERQHLTNPLRSGCR
ncbi:MAG: hypothetical protein H6Q89_2092 [Myxococcaceae bacterium]|nr:hypothetical protein [Myxococcaceae bacterium]